MSILIKGMEMPVFEHQSWDIRKGADGKWYMVDTNAETSDGEWHEIVPVPKHGRLIDGDNLALLVLNWISTQEKAYPHEDSNALAWRLGAKAMGNQIYRDIKAYPTIIPASEGET